MPLNTNKKFFIVTPYFNVGDLTDFLGSLETQNMPENMAREVIWQISRAVQELHKLNIYHRDIKMMNIFVRKYGNSDLKFVLADFGISCLLEPGQMMTERSGTMHWMAPEVVNKKANGLKADIWSLGVLLYGLISG